VAHSTNSDTLLVTGAGGKLGRRVIANLIEAQNVPPSRIVAGTRAPEKLDDLAARGVVVRRLDLGDESTLGAAFAGVARVLLISTDAIGQRIGQHRAGIAAAEKAGVEHVLYTSMPNPDRAKALFAPEHLGTEKALAQSTLPSWTSLRMNWYSENLFMALPAALGIGQWFTATGNGRAAYISREDCARTAAAALASSADASLDKKALDVTGAKALGIEDVAAIARRILEAPLEVVHVDAAQLKRGMVSNGVPAPIADLLVSLDETTRAGDLDVVTDTVERLTGSAPQSLEAWFAENRHAFANR
jgi:NAD(P)H dehydrogenase (quinone)